MLSFSPAGIHCEPGGFHIDPSRRVELALITHAHSDHARRGSRRYLCERSGAGLLRHRLGPQAVVETIRYGEKIKLGRAWVSFHPAGHILGSAQIRVEIGDRVWVVSGDYKREADPTCEPFEVLPCDTFITEATFGHPQYEWSGTAGEFEEIHRWWAQCAERGRSAILFCYSLGKTQRILGELARLPEIGQKTAFVTGEAAELVELYRREGVIMLPTQSLERLTGGRLPPGSLLVGPQSLLKGELASRLGEFETAFASGWMQGGGAFGMAARYDRGFVVSDHADWNALLRTVSETGAKRVLIQHASCGALARELKARGIEAAPWTESSARDAARPIQTGFAFA